MAVYSQRNLALARFGGNTADTLLAAHTRRHFVSQISTANTRSFVSEELEGKIAISPLTERDRSFLEGVNGV